MKRYKAVLLSVSAEQVYYVYSKAQLAELAEITELRDGIADQKDVESGALSDIEVIFSTWGMPGLESGQIARMPNLKAVFYAAGATDYFARPFLARGIQVHSAWKANAIPVAEFCVSLSSYIFNK